MWGNSSEIHIYDAYSYCTLNYCCVDNTGYDGHTGNITENNCIHQDPRFVGAAGGYHLKSSSPCIDAGDNSLVPSGVDEDLDGNERVVDGDNDGVATVDIGAYEYQMQIATTALPDATEGVAYSYTVQATGGNWANYNWSISGQPSWLSIDAATGELSGTPPAGSAGTYTFTVSVTDGQRTASKQFVLVVKLFSVNFEASPTQGKAPLTVKFTDKSRGTITQWEWDFDNDGKVDSYDQNPQWTYNDAGWYTVRLTISNGTSSDTCVREKFVQVGTNVYYVDGVNGDDTNSGTGWSDAFATIGKALSVASDYDLVLVADATYDETNLNFNGKKIYLKGVDYHLGGLTRPVIDCQNSGSAFYFGSGETKDSVVDNFVIQNGRVEDTYGGAVVCENNSSPAIRNCVFQGNKAEDTNGLYDYEDGGAISCTDSSSPSIIDCTFKNNAALRGGAVSCRDNSSPMIVGCTFSDNSASDDGGAIFCIDSSSPTITNSTFSGNSTANWCGGAIACWNSSSPTVSNCTFSRNSADDYGGAIYCDSSSPTVSNCTFSHNNVSDYGGAISCLNNSSPSITNCTFSGNSCLLYTSPSPRD